MLVIPIVRVGNSRGIRFPKKVLDAIGSPAEVQLDVKNGFLVIRPVTTPRQGWDAAARWAGSKLTQEDLDWLDAPLMADL